MGAPPFLANLDVGELCGAAGGNPWKLDDELQAGDAQAINKLADAFHQAGHRVKEADDDFDKAKQKFEAGYRRNGSEHPINESAEVRQATVALAGHTDALPQIAASLEQVAASLVTAQRHSDYALGEADGALDEIDDQMAAAKTNNQDTGGLHEHAVGVVTSALAQVNSVRAGYAADLHAAQTAMSGAGFVPESLADLDAAPGDAATDAAAKYDTSGQRARDQAMVDKAHAAGRTHYLANNAGSPGNMTDDEAAAAQRLKDYAAITDPTSRFGPGYDPHEAAQAHRLAGERLDDYNVANATGPVPSDPVLGGDARIRAQARLKLQHDLENGQVPWHPQPMSTDEATQVIDQTEGADRASVLARLPGQLQQAGMSPQGAAAVVEGLAHGKIPEEYIEAAGGAGKVFESGEKAFDKYAGLVTDHGSHWTPEAAALNTDDVEAFEKLGKRIGRFGSLLELGTATYELTHGADPGEVAAKAAGGWAGATELGGLGAAGGEIVGGPLGAFMLGLIGGTVGAFGGEWGADKVHQWLKE
ncbi:hypothetical protein [Mycobacterium sp.]|uniref:putative alpha/beta hydrolase n=1 Tax=Mycobacterium sp. TaxID=1785 RepID=UPI0031DE6084